MYNKDLVGKEVVGTDARKVGAVTRVMIDMNGWQVKELEVIDNGIIVLPD